MDIIVGNYENRRVNEKANVWTIDTTLEPAGLGGVDHYMCRSVKMIVSRYVRRLKRDSNYGYPGAKYNIVIKLTKDPLKRGLFSDPDEVITVPVQCQ